jgi:selenocysteine lyase/cysteine desulfurase
VRILRRQNIIAAPRAGWVRTSPHFYISPADIDRVIDTLP